MGNTPAVDVTEDFFTSAGDCSANGQRPCSGFVPVGPWFGCDNRFLRSSVRRHRPKSVHSPLVLGWRAPKYFQHFGAVAVGDRVGIITADRFGSGFEYGYAMLFPASLIPYEQVSDRTVNLCLIKTRNSLRDNGAQLGVGFLERKKTAQMMGGKALDLLNGIRKFRRGLANPEAWTEFAKTNLAFASRAAGRPYQQQRRLRKTWLDGLTPKARRIANEYLEHTYGWVPLLQDMHSGVNALADFASSNPRTLVHVKEKLVEENSDALRWDGSSANTNWKLLRHVRKFKSVMIRLDFEVDSPSVRFASDIGLLNPTSIAWEMVPYSFVVDWALPIGPWLESLDASAGLTFLGGSCSKLTRVTERTISTPRFDGETQVRLQEFGPGRRSMFNFERTVYTSEPYPSPPWFDFKVGTRRFANALALAAQLLGRRV